MDPTAIVNLALLALQAVLSMITTIKAQFGLTDDQILAAAQQVAAGNDAAYAALVAALKPPDFLRLSGGAVAETSGMRGTQNRPDSFMDPLEPLYRWIGSKIKVAEGYGLVDAIPTDARNPGDLCLGNRFWAIAIHRGFEFKGSINGVTIYPKANEFCDIEDPKDGFAALYREIRMIRNGTSTIYRPEWTITDVSTRWTKTDPVDWAKTVSEGLGVDPSTPFNELKPPQAISA